MMSRSEIENKVTDAIIAALESGTAPWTKPWTGADDRPRSLSTKKLYRGINVLILDVASTLGGFSSPWWGTFKQIKALGGHVRKGEKSTAIVFWKVIEIEERGETKKLPMLRSFNVFNADQAEGLDLDVEEKGEPVSVDQAVESVVEGYEDGPEIRHRRGDKAFYTPSVDAITLPEMDQFKGEAEYISTLFHEMVHSTGHSSRLDRFEPNQTFGCEGYAREELVAEMGAAMLAATSGVAVEVENSASYIANWLKVLKDDRSMLIKAAQQAQKAVDRIAPVEARVLVDA
jgi:antirestriction protein ArdC